MKRTAALVLFALASTLLPWRLNGAGVSVVLSAELGPYQEALAGAKEVLSEAPEVVILKDGKAEVSKGATVIIALGGQAAMADYPSGASLVYAMVPDPKVKPSRSKACRISMLPDAASLFARIKAIQPGLKSLAAMGVGDSYDAYLKELSDAANDAGVKLQVKKVNKIADLVAALRAIKDSAEGFWVPPDTLLMNPEAFKLMTDFALGAKLALYAPATSLAKTGALAGIAPSFKEIGRTAAAAANVFGSGGNPGVSMAPQKNDVSINGKTAKAMGLMVPAGAGTLLP